MAYETFIFVVMEVIWGHIFGHREVEKPLNDLKCWRLKCCSNYLSFDISLDMAYETFIFVVMEVIWGHVFGHREVK